ncbi:MAG: hypothetical protein WD716_11290 [Fimbriimonadaceae bacterium]
MDLTRFCAKCRPIFERDPDRSADNDICPACKKIWMKAVFGDLEGIVSFDGPIEAKKPETEH